LPVDDFEKCFAGAFYSVERTGYSSHYYDVNSDDGNQKEFEFMIPEENGDLFFTVETYPYHMIPERCYWDFLTKKKDQGNPYFEVEVYKEGVKKYSSEVPSTSTVFYGFFYG